MGLLEAVGVVDTWRPVTTLTAGTPCRAGVLANCPVAIGDYFTVRGDSIASAFASIPGVHVSSVTEDIADVVSSSIFVRNYTVLFSVDADTVSADFLGAVAQSLSQVNASKSWSCSDVHLTYLEEMTAPADLGGAGKVLSLISIAVVAVVILVLVNKSEGIIKK